MGQALWVLLVLTTCAGLCAAQAPAPAAKRMRVCAAQPQARLIHWRLPAEEALAEATRSLANLEQVVHRAGRAGCDILALPEDTLGLLHWEMGNTAKLKDVLPAAVAAMLERLGRAAAEHGMYLICSSDVAEQDGTYRNAAFFLGRDGKEIGRYHKVNLPLHESGRKRGESFPVFETPDLGGVGMLICYDMLMPEAARSLALGGADIVFVPTMGGASYGDADMNRAAFRTRAVDNFVYLVVARRGGGAMIISPLGKVLAEGKGANDIAMADIDPFGGREAGDALNSQSDMRARLFRERNPAAYGLLTAPNPPALRKLPATITVEEAVRIGAGTLTIGEERFAAAQALLAAGKTAEATRAFEELRAEFPHTWIDRSAKARLAQIRSGRAAAAPFSVVEAGIPAMRDAMEQGRLTSRELVTAYLLRIARYEDKLNAAITVNPHALEEAEARDHERAAGKVRGPLHGIPVALKDNIHTTDMPTTGGTLAFEGFIPPYEATITKHLREAGAVIIAKTGMTELANWVASGMPGNYNALSGYGMNPYDPRRDPRTAIADGRPALATGGSSSGIGTAASFWTANVGTETSGSILSPANQNMLAAIKPTVGRISRYGIIPITADQDTAGPMAKTVTDAAILLGAMEGAAPDPNDPATARCAPPAGRDYSKYLRADALKGARIGIPRAFYFDPHTPAGAEKPRGGLNADQKAVMQEAIGILKEMGAVIVDPADLPSVVAPDKRDNLLAWNICAGASGAKGKDQECSTVFKYGMKRDFNAWLATLGPAAPVKSLTALREFNLAHKGAGAIKYGQAQLDISDEMDLERDRARYEADRARGIALAAANGIDAAIKKHRLDALLFPGATGYSVAATPGYPTVMVPFGMVPNSPTPPFPDGFNAKAAPLGVSFTGTACSEPKLIELAYAFEQATKRRVPPPSVP